MALRSLRSPWLLALPLIAAIVFSACDGGNDNNSQAFTPGPLQCQGLGTNNYNYTVHVEEEVIALEGTPIPDTQAPISPVKIVWDIDGSVERGSSLLDYAVHTRQRNDLGGSIGETETILLSDGRGYTKLASGWQAGSDRPPPLPHLPSVICLAMSPSFDTTKLPVGQSETINGVASKRFTFQNFESDLVSRDSDFGAGSDAAFITTFSGDIWVADEGQMVTKVDFAGQGNYPNGQPIRLLIQMELRDVGTDIKVEAPI